MCDYCEKYMSWLNDKPLKENSQNIELAHGGLFSNGSCEGTGG